MDISTVIGILIGIFFVILAICMSGSLGTFINPPGLMVVIGGTLAATLMTFRLADVLGVISVLMKAFFTPKNNKSEELIATLVELAQEARKEGGVMQLGGHVERLPNEEMQNWLQLAVDAMETSMLRSTMETELMCIETRHDMGQEIFTSMAKYAPAFGMIGTLIGLVQMLSTMDDPTTIGPSMAVALLTTFYGALLANLVFIPIAGKLKNRSQEETLFRQIALEGILMIQDGANPASIRNNLIGYLPPKARRGVPARAATAAAPQEA